MMMLLRCRSDLFRGVRYVPVRRTRIDFRYVSAATTSVSAIPTSSPTIQLRDYQEECIQSVLSHLDKGNRRLGVSLATGSGKTVIFTHLIDRVPPTSERGSQTLILVHRRELAEQAARHCIDAYPSKSVEIEMGSHHASGAADITIASIKSLLSGGRLEKFHPERFKLVLVDEAHHIVAPGYLSVLGHFGLVKTSLPTQPEESQPSPLEPLSSERPSAELSTPDSESHLANVAPSCPALVGVSATLSRFDGVSLGAALDHIVYHKDYVDMIDENWLATVIFTTVKTKVDLRKVRASASGDFNTSALGEAVNTPDMNEVTVRTWLARAANRSSTMVFCVNIAHVRDLTAAFLKHGVQAQYVTGEDLPRDRAHKLESFKRGEYPVLLNCGVFTEGTDVPNVDCVLLARPTRSRNLLVQMIGRGLRLHPDKKNCHVLDMVSALSTGIVTTPTLFGLDPFELVQEATAKELRALGERKAKGEAPTTLEGNGGMAAEPDGLPRRVTFTDYDNVQDLIEDTSGERHIQALSPLAWVRSNDDQYHLEGNGGSYLAIDKELDDENAATEPNEARYTVRYVERLPPPADPKKKFRGYKRSREMGHGMTFTNAVYSLGDDNVLERSLMALEARRSTQSVFYQPPLPCSEIFPTDKEWLKHAADTLADKLFVRAFVLRNASWRRTPATSGQINYINKFREEDDQLSSEDVTKGLATDMITRIKCGARGRFQRLKAAAAREERQETRARKLAEREEVRMGPLATDSGTI